jgi:hypothetical protein
MINRFGADHGSDFGNNGNKHRDPGGDDALGAGLDGLRRGEVWRADPTGGGRGPAPLVGPVRAGVDRFTEEQMFEEDLRAVLSMMRPHRHERLMGWSEYRTGGAHFRATISWDPGAVEPADGGRAGPGSDDGAAGEEHLCIPHLTDVLESILVGSVKNQDELPAEQEFEIYRGVVRELFRRLNEMQACYE